MKIEFTPFKKKLTPKSIDDLSKIGNNFIVKLSYIEEKYDYIKFRREKFVKFRIEMLSINHNITLLGHDFIHYNNEITIESYCLLEFDKQDEEYLSL